MEHIYDRNPRIFLLSAVATLISLSTLYLSELRNADLQLLPSQVAWLAMDRHGSREVISLPFTVSNHGTRTGAVRDLRLRITDRAGRERRFYAAWIGPRPALDNIPFAPIAVEGKSSTTSAVLFYPLRPQQPLISASGDYTIELTYIIEAGPSLFDIGSELVEISSDYIKEIKNIIDPVQPSETAGTNPKSTVSYSRETFTLRLKQFSRPDLENGRLIRMAPLDWDNS